VNRAPDGAVISSSEELVRDAIGMLAEDFFWADDLRFGPTWEELGRTVTY
jgi:hypothetical protein